jgi:hypothetical protein
MIVKNERGNVLVIVLLLITVFSLLYFSIIGFSFNNAKQINQTEERFQAVSLAEMGVEYYKSAIHSIVDSYTISDSLINTIKNKYSSDFDGDKIVIYAKTDYEIFELLAVEIKNELSSKLPTLDKNILVDATSNSSYEIKNDSVSHNFNSEDNSLNIRYDFTSTGNAVGKTINLNAKFNIPISKIIFKIVPDNTGGEPGDGKWEPIVSFDKIVDPGTLNLCSNNISNLNNTNCQSISFPSNTNEKVENSTLKILENTEIPKNITSISNTTLYFTEDLILDGGINQSSNMSLHIGGNLDSKQQINVNNNSLLEVGGNATFNNSFDVENSSVYIGGSAIFKQNINPSNNSTVYINSDTIINGNMHFQDNNKFCVYGDLEIKSNITSIGNNSKLIVIGNITVSGINNIGTNSFIASGGKLIASNVNGDKSKIFANSSNVPNEVTITDESYFETECGGYPDKKSLEFDGQYYGTPTISTSYQYGY